MVVFSSSFMRFTIQKLRFDATGEREDGRKTALEAKKLGTPPIRSDPGRCRSASSLGLIGAGKSQQQGGKHGRRKTRGGIFNAVPDFRFVFFRRDFHRAYLNLLKNIISLFRRESSLIPKKKRYFVLVSAWEEFRLTAAGMPYEQTPFLRGVAEVIGVIPA